MLRVGLTGGIGAGKSAAARRLAEHGAIIVDSDRIARDVVLPGTAGLREIIAAFGDRVLDAEGRLDRAAVAGIVFADPAARARLEEIVHPRVRSRSAELVATAPADAVVVNDVPLLVEVGLAAAYHLVLVVTAAPETRVARLVRDRGLSREQARERIAAQADDARRQAAADVLLSNEGELTDLHRAVDLVWRDRLVPYEDNLRHRRPAPPAPRVLVEPDPAWPGQFDRLAARIRHATGSATLRIDHVGPTAVCGLPAPDVIEIQVTAASVGEAAALTGPLIEAGFPPYSGELGRLDRRYHRSTAGRIGGQRVRPEAPLRGAGGPTHRCADPGRPADVYVRVAGTAEWRSALLVRDYLRANPDARATYQERRDRAEEPWAVEDGAPAERWALTSGWRP